MNSEIGLTMHIGDIQQAAISEQSIRDHYSGRIIAERNNGALKVASGRAPKWIDLLKKVEKHAHKKGIKTQRHGRWPN